MLQALQSAAFHCKYNKSVLEVTTTVIFIGVPNHREQDLSSCLVDVAGKMLSKVSSELQLSLINNGPSLRFLSENFFELSARFKTLSCLGSEDNELVLGNFR
jgi:hypothetical protein